MPRLATGRRGAVALEFAILAVPLLVLTFGTMELGYDYFVQAELDNAVNLAARGVQVGSSQYNKGGSGAGFVAASVCPDLGGLLSCNSLYVAVTPISTSTPPDTDYYQWLQANPPSLALASGTAGNGGVVDPVNTGAGCQVMMLEAYYLGPSFLGTLVPGFSTSFTPVGGSSHLVHVTYSGAGFINENFNGHAGC